MPSPIANGDGLKTCCPAKPLTSLTPASNNRQFVDAVLRRYHAGIPRRDLPERFADFGMMHLRLSRWSCSGVWQRVFQALAQEADNALAMIDSTIVRAHQHSAGGEKIKLAKPSFAAQGD